MDEPSTEAKQVLAAYRRARAVDPAVHERVRGRLAGSLEGRTRVETNRTGQAIAVSLLVAAVLVLVVAVMWAGVRERDLEHARPPTSAQRDVAAKPELPVSTTTPPAELPAVPPAVERDDDLPAPVVPLAREAPAVRVEPSPVDAELQRELELLRDAKAHRDAGDTAKSLAVLAAHSREFPKGQLAEERDAIAIEIRCKTAERPRARRELEAFGRAHATSTHLVRLRRACE